MTTRTPLYFDYLTHARAAGLDNEQIDALVERWRRDYHDDYNLLELRLLRVCKALESKLITYDEALAPEPDGPPQFGFFVAEDQHPYRKQESGE